MKNERDWAERIEGKIQLKSTKSRVVRLDKNELNTVTRQKGRKKEVNSTNNIRI